MIKNLLVSLILVLIFNLVFYQSSLGIGFTLFLTFVNIGLYFTKKVEQSSNIRLGLGFSAISILFALLTVFRTNEIVLAVDLFGSIIFVLVAGYFYHNNNLFNFTLPEFLLIPLQSVQLSFASVGRLLKVSSYSEEKSQYGVIKAIGRGMLFSIPVVAILLFLLTQADPIFNKLTQKILETSFERALFSLLVFIITLTLSLIVVKEKIKKDFEMKISPHKGFELSMILGSVAILFGLFIIVQFQYLFSSISEKQLAEIGVKSLTYSEYVRKGFFELILVGLISSGLLSFVLKWIKSISGKQKLTVQLLSSIVIFETLGIILSATQRVNLYQLEHGLTRARIFGMIFYGYLTLFLVILFIHLILHLKNKTYFFSNLVIALMAFLMINLINIDGLIAANFQPTVNGKIDYYYISNLSADAYQSWPEVLTVSEQVITDLENAQKTKSLIEIPTDIRQDFFYAEHSLIHIQRHLNNLSKKRWNEYNSTAVAAYKMSQETKMKERTENLISRFVEFKQTPTFNSIQDVPLDRSTSPPLVR